MAHAIVSPAPVALSLDAPTWALSCSFGCGEYIEFDRGMPAPRPQRCFACGSLMLVEQARVTGERGPWNTGVSIPRLPTLSHIERDWQ